jgi:hypothetical protein
MNPHTDPADSGDGENMDITATIDTTDMKNHGWVELRDGWHITGIDSRDDGQTITSPIVAIDRAAKLAQTKSGSIYHVPGPWPDHIDLPAMRGEVREWVEPEDEDDVFPALSDYFATEGAGSWGSIAQCTDLLPGVTLDAYRDALEAKIEIDRFQMAATHPAANTPKAIAEALRDLPALRAWLLSELDAARAVVGGAA